MAANTRYKDSVFSVLFSDPDILKELYCALKDVTLPEGLPVTINTLQDVLFMDRINDISFEIGGKLVILVEHQSTINPNMALRLLMYIARVYEKIVGDRNIYTSKKVRIPRPEFFVLYNGAAPYQDEEVLRLSDAFEEIGTLGILEQGSPALELAVKVVNINQGRNEGIVKKCKTLFEYSAFVEKVREYEQGSGSKEQRAKNKKEGKDNLEAAIKKAIVYCREHDILKEFLEKNATEVINMLMTEWNWDDALAVRFEEGREEVASNALAEGASIEFVKKITGFDDETIKKLQEAVNNGAK